MQLLLISFVLIAIVVLIMSVGVIMGRKPVQGSCGGLNRIDGMNECDICGGDKNKCDDVTASGSQAARDSTG